MKNTIKLLGIIAIVAVVSTMMACDSGGGGPRIEIHNTDGRLTITGLEAHNGRWVFGLGWADEYDIRIFHNISRQGIATGGQVVEGSVELNVWRIIRDGVLGNFDYSGQGSIETIIIANRSSLGDGELDALWDYEDGEGPRPAWLMDWTTSTKHVPFTNGIGSMAWQQ